MEYKFLFSIASLAVCLQYVYSLEVIDCGSHFMFDAITVEGCPNNSDSCDLLIGSTTQISFLLNTGKPFGEFNINAELINDVTFYVPGGPRFNLTVNPLNPCEVLACPLNINYSANFTAGIFVDHKYQPMGNVYLQWILETADLQEQLLCFKFPIALHNSSL